VNLGLVMAHLRAVSLVFVSTLALACGDDGGETPADTESASTDTGSSANTTSAGLDDDDDDDSTMAESSSGGGSTSSDPTTGAVDSSGTDSTGGSDGSDSSGGEESQRVLLAVGYGGIRVRSLDDGQTWQDYTQLVDSGGDDMRNP